MAVQDVKLVDDLVGKLETLIIRLDGLLQAIDSMMAKGLSEGSRSITWKKREPT